MENNEDEKIVSTTTSIHESNDVSPLLPYDKAKFRFTVEPVMLLLLMGFNISSIVQINFLEERTCLHSKLGQNKSVDCFNMTVAEQEIIQPTVANLNMIKNLIETILPCITTLFLGPWSDVNGRLPLLLSALSGFVIHDCMYCVFSTIPELPPIMSLLCSLPIAMSGGSGALFIASYCYIVDITDTKTRAFRLGVLQACTSLGSILGPLISPMLYKYSLTYNFAMTSIFTIIGLLYAYLFLKETVVIKKDVNTKLFNINLITDLCRTIMKQRVGYLRCIIILSTMGLTLNKINIKGNFSLLYMYLQKQFSWTLENFAIFDAYSSLLNASIPVIGLYILSTKLEIPDMYLATASTVLGIIENVGLAYSIHTWEFYFTKIFGVLLISEPIVRSQLSKSFPPEDLGKIFTFISVIEGLGLIIGSPLYTTVYDITIHNFSNCIFLLSSILETFVTVLYIIILFLLSRSIKPVYLLIEN